MHLRCRSCSVTGSSPPWSADAPVLGKAADSSLGSGCSQPISLLALPPAAAVYRASGLVLWHFSDVAGLTDDVRSQGVKRTHSRRRGNDANDRGCVKTRSSQGCTELFSQWPSSDRSYRCNWFPHRRNRDGNSTGKLNVRVFTQPRPGTNIDQPPLEGSRARYSSGLA
jgi:hypothetical protein